MGRLALSSHRRVWQPTFLPVGGNLLGGSEMKCIVCNDKEATVPDRNEGCFAKRKKVCSDCHANRLKNDFINILLVERKRREAQDES